MSDHKHTPSPWWVENENEGDPQEYGPLWCVKGGTLDEDGPYMEAVLHFGVREDAVLMAAAPALRDALRDAVALLHTAHKTPWREHDAALRRFDRDHSYALTQIEGSAE